MQGFLPKKRTLKVVSFQGRSIVMETSYGEKFYE